ncbi:uncharacterized protein METZ01_LOCUS336454, partial [marine metagenome]
VLYISYKKLITLQIYELFERPILDREYFDQ